MNNSGNHTQHLQSEIAELRKRYKEAIRNGELFGQVKKIYEQLKQLEKTLQGSTTIQSFGKTA